jgi:mannosyltransferase OCH1-like enzyme
MIPKILHQIWLGKKPFKEPFLRATFALNNPLWTFMMWTDENLHSSELPGDVIRMALDEKISYVVRGDCLRYAAMYVYGGVYADADQKCLRPLDSLLDTQGFASESYNEMGNSLIGCVAGYPPAGEAMNATLSGILADPAACNRDPPHTVGVKFQGQFLKKFHTIYPCRYFQPFPYTAHEGREKEWPESYTAHQWHGMDADGWTKQRF